MADRRDETRPKDRTSNKYAARKAATERVAAERAAQQRAERRRNVMVAGSATLAVLIVVAVIVVIGVTHKSGSSTNKPTASGSAAAGNPVVPASSALISALGNVPATNTGLDFSPLKAGLPKQLSGSPLTGSKGKPQVLYIGADYCPYCAATRWPLAVALSRFGTFDKLTTTYSSDKDAAPHTPTLSFHDVGYSSKYVDFVGVEHQDGAGNALDPLTTQQEQLLANEGGNSYPFIDFGGKWAQHGSLFDPTILAGMTPDQVAAALSDTSKKQGATIQAGADLYSAIICQTDGGQPSNVCTAAGVKAAESQLNAAK